MKTSKVRVVCLECGRRFWTASPIPECPGCHGSDIELEPMGSSVSAARVTLYGLLPPPVLEGVMA